MEEPTSTQMDQSHDNPWNPDAPVHITPEEYEKQVCTWLSNAAKKDGNNIRWLHREVVEGQGGDYQIDVTGEMSLLGGATLRILVECKRCRRPVERDELLAHAMKVQDTASHKGMVFSTAGFQSGALKFAKSKGVATAILTGGGANYFTKSLGPHKSLPTHSAFPQYGAWFVTQGETAVGMSWLASDRLDPIIEWICERPMSRDL